jgi:hypothetical protein
VCACNADESCSPTRDLQEEDGGLHSYVCFSRSREGRDCVGVCWSDGGLK